MSVPPGCREAVRRLWDHLDRGLEPNHEQQLEQHLAFCRRCCGELEFVRELRTLLRTPTAASLPPDVHDRLDGVIDALGGDESLAGA